ncbi:divalent metal cation transporter [Candidatus Roizmanbacteria bacterium]|nr:divalent metal cation transporter [Candidatus Roizmanbacteria bacterium]
MNRFIELFRVWRRRFLVFLIVLGPGLITAVTNNDAGGVATYTVAASMYGVASRFLLVPEVLLLAISQDIGARIAIVTKKGLGDLIRERFGVRTAVFLFGLYFIANQGVVLQNISGLKTSYQIFNLPWEILLTATCLILIAVVVRFSYRSLQNIFLFLIFFYLSYVFVAFITKPDWNLAFRDAFIWPQQVKLDLTYWFTRIAVLGTTITAWGQFFIHSYTADKKLSEEHIRYERAEIYAGSLVTTFFSFMMIIAVSETLFKNHIVAQDGYSAALALRPLAGELTQALFAVGLFGASLLGLTIIPLATAYVFAELFGYEGGLDTDFKRGRLFYSFFITQIVVALLIALFPAVRLFKLTLYVDFLNGAMLPVIFYFLIKFAENKDMMGRYVVRGFSRFFLRASAVFITAAVVVSFIGRIFKII